MGRDEYSTVEAEQLLEHAWIVKEIIRVQRREQRESRGADKRIMREVAR